MSNSQVEQVKKELFKEFRKNATSNKDVASLFEKFLALDGHIKVNPKQ